MTEKPTQPKLHESSEVRHALAEGEGKRRRFVPAKQVVAAFKDTPCIDYEQLRADLDAVVDQDPTPRF
jgi:hypothetical protein